MMPIQRLGAGEALTAVGVFHAAAGLAKYRHALREMAHEGLVDAVKGDHERGRPSGSSCAVRPSSSRAAWPAGQKCEPGRCLPRWVGCSSVLAW
jgi:Family of unknown function (DUF6463)